MPGEGAPSIPRAAEATRVKGVGRGRQGLARCTDTQAPLPAQSHSASLLRGKKLSLPLLFFLLHPWNPLGKWEEEGLGA